MTFETDKQTILSKDDKSSKGRIDVRIRKMCDLINSKPDYYTTSSCSGRTVVIKLPCSGKKNESKWSYSTHGLADADKIKSAVPIQVPESEKSATVSRQDNSWFRFEPFIIHIACRTAEHADRLIRTTKSLGLKRSGIISLGSKNTVEITGSGHIAAPLTQTIPDNYIDLLVKESNFKMQQNWNILRKLEQAIEKI